VRGGRREWRPVFQRVLYSEWCNGALGVLRIADSERTGEPPSSQPSRSGCGFDALLPGGSGCHAPYYRRDGDRALGRPLLFRPECGPSTGNVLHGFLLAPRSVWRGRYVGPFISGGRRGKAHPVIAGAGAASWPAGAGFLAHVRAGSPQSTRPVERSRRPWGRCCTWSVSGRLWIQRVCPTP